MAGALGAAEPLAAVDFNEDMAQMTLDELGLDGVPFVVTARSQGSET